MNWKLRQMGTFHVLGVAGEGPADQGAQWVSPLWEEASARFDEIAGLAELDSDGRPILWGAMRDASGEFRPWDKLGQYLAGCQVAGSVEPPAGWECWQIPAGQCLVVRCTPRTMGAVIDTIVAEVLPQEQLRLNGAIQEHLPAPDTPDILELYFPVEPLEG